MKQLVILGLSDIVVCPTWFNNDKARGQLPDGLDPLRDAMATPGTEEYNETQVEQETKEWMASGSLFKTERGHWVKFIAGMAAVHPETIILLVDGYPASLLSYATRDIQQLINEMTQWTAKMKPRESYLAKGHEIVHKPSPVETVLQLDSLVTKWDTPEFKGAPKVKYTHTPKYKDLRDIYLEVEKWAESESYDFFDFHNSRLDTYFPEISKYIISVEEFTRRQRQPQRPSQIQAPSGAPPGIALA